MNLLGHVPPLRFHSEPKHRCPTFKATAMSQHRGTCLCEGLWQGPAQPFVTPQSRLGRPGASQVASPGVFQLLPHRDLAGPVHSHPDSFCGWWPSAVPACFRKPRLAARKNPFLPSPRWRPRRRTPSYGPVTCADKPPHCLSWMGPREVPFLVLSLLSAPGRLSTASAWLGELTSESTCAGNPASRAICGFSALRSLSQAPPSYVSVNSSRTILDANEEFKSMSGTIQLGRKLITKYNRRELTDKLLIFLALALFLATVLYIVKKRLFPFL